MDIDLTTEPLGTDGRQAGLPARHLADRTKRSQPTRAAARQLARCSSSEYAQRLRRRRAAGSAMQIPDRRSSTRGTTTPPTSRSRRTSTTWSIRTRRVQDLQRHARAGAAGRFRHHRPHLAGRLHRQGQPGRAVSDRAGREAGGFQLLRRAPRQSRGDGARHAGQHPPAQSAGARHRGRL